MYLIIECFHRFLGTGQALSAPKYLLKSEQFGFLKHPRVLDKGLWTIIIPNLQMRKMSFGASK